MRYARLFGKTVRSVPAALKAKSHQLLYKGGFIRQVAAGRYVFLPLGMRVRDKIEAIIEEEMQQVGSQKVVTPNLHPIELWKKTNRDAAFGEEMYIIKDHQGATFALGATAEGLMLETVMGFKPSYRDLPIYIHQFSNKFRDEKRPKAGLMRVREFVMKDAYSFDRSEKDSLIAYKKFYNAYLRIAKRFGLKVIPVLADSGAIGGDYNHEFLVESANGEGEGLLCSQCDYAAHVERAESGFETYPQDKKMKPVKEYYDTKAVTCEVLAENMGVPIQVTTKTILFRSGEKFIAAMVRGDYDINEAKLKRHLNLDSLELATEAEVMRLSGAKVGFAGPIGLPKGTIIVADLSCKERVNFEVGANKTGYHLYNVNFERDLPTPAFADIRKAKEGDQCLKCKQGRLRLVRGIEWGHCFKLDTFYSRPHGGTYKASDGQEKLMWMGSYGIGLGRSMATIVEVHHDEKGIIWPESVAPFQAHLVSLENQQSAISNQAEKIYTQLTGAGVEVLWDDRDESAGVKLADADLIGIPVRLVVSPKTKDKLEWKKRNQDKTEIIGIEQAINRLTS